MFRKIPVCAAALAVLLISPAVQADDPPLRVGRLSYVEGTVSFHGADDNDWSYATLNYPVVSGNSFWTQPDGRSEIQIGSVEIRMDHATEMEVMQLDESATRLNVPQGAVNIHFATPPVNGSIEVMTPSGPVELTRPGTYHIDSGTPSADGSPLPVQVTALEGQLEIRSPRSVLEVMPGETAMLTGNPPAFSLQEGNATPFDDWALSRERREEAHQAAQYVSPHMTGYEDLDYSGQWTNDPDYGRIWYPTVVQADWAPYRYGHWAYVAPWGWTWIDDASWGFAPFHYGRWARLHDRWCWAPGAVVPRPVYAPALVAFVGGAGWNISLNIGGSAPAVGWVPLAPREVFYPYYPTSVNYTRNVNVAYVNKTVINNITVNNIHNVRVNNYINREAATVVPAQAFQHGQPVHKTIVQVSQQQLAHAPVTPTLAHIAPAAAAREEGRPVSSSQQPMPHPDQEDARKNRENAVQIPQAVHTPQPVNAQHPQPPHEAALSPHTPEEHHGMPEAHSSANMIQYHAGEKPEGSHAPGPQFHPVAPAQRQQQLAHFPMPEESRQALPKAQVPHPEQRSEIRPTPQGWQRASQPHEPQQHEPKPSDQHEQHKPAPEDEKHRPGEH